MSKVKICGLSRFEDIDYANEFMPDYIGFVFAESKRKVSLSTALELKSRLKSDILSVGVFVNADLSAVNEAAHSGAIDMIQLHGDEDEKYINALRELTNLKIIKALRVRSTQQVLKAQSLPCDYLLLDSYVKGSYGGAGSAFNWDLIPELKKSFFLAGGLNEENILTAMNTVNPYCLDISSGVEENGVKSRDKIERVIRLIRSGK